MYETILAISILVTSFLYSYIDPSKSALFEYVVVSLIGYLCGRVTERSKCVMQKGENDAKNYPSRT